MRHGGGSASGPGWRGEAAGQRTCGGYREVTSVVIPRDIPVSKYLNIYGCTFYEASVHPWNGVWSRCNAMGLALNTPDTGGREKLAGIWWQFWKYVVTILHLSHVFMFGWGVRTRGHLLSPVGVETPAQPCNDDGGKNLMCPWCGQTRHVLYTWHMCNWVQFRP